jgi:hypothetical protein
MERAAGSVKKDARNPPFLCRVFGPFLTPFLTWFVAGVGRAGKKREDGGKVTGRSQEGNREDRETGGKEPGREREGCGFGFPKPIRTA